MVIFIMVFPLLSSCAKTYTCEVHTHIERYGVSGYPPNLKPYLSGVTDTVEYINILSKPKDLHYQEANRTYGKIDSFPTSYEGIYTRRITIQTTKCIR